MLSFVSRRGCLARTLRPRGCHPTAFYPVIRGAVIRQPPSSMAPAAADAADPVEEGATAAADAANPVEEDAATAAAAANVPSDIPSDKNLRRYGNWAIKWCRMLFSDAEGEPTVGGVSVDEPLPVAAWLPEKKGQGGVFSETEEVVFDVHRWLDIIPETLKDQLVGPGIQSVSIVPVPGTWDPHPHMKGPVWDIAFTRTDDTVAYAHPDRDGKLAKVRVGPPCASGGKKLRERIGGLYPGCMPPQTQPSKRPVVHPHEHLSLFGGEPDNSLDQARLRLAARLTPKPDPAPAGSAAPAAEVPESVTTESNNPWQDAQEAQDAAEETWSVVA